MAAAPPGAVASASPPGASPPTGPRPHRIWLAVVATAVVVSLVLGLVIVEESPRPSSGGGSGARLASEQAAQGTANSVLRSLPGGPWSLRDAQGYDSPTGDNGSAQALVPINSTCFFHNATVSTFSLAPFTGDYAQGTAEAWLFLYASADEGAVVLVQNGTGYLMGELPEPACSVLSRFSEIPAGLVDSTAAAAAVDAAPAGASFTANVTPASAIYTLATGSVLLGSSPANVTLWSVRYSGCLAAHVTALDAYVYATNGTVLSEVVDRGGACTGGGTTPIGSAFAGGPAFLSTCPTNDTYALDGCTAGDYAYTVTVDSSSVNFTSLLFEVKTADGAIVQLAVDGGFSIVAVNGLVAAQSDPSTDLAMSSVFATFGASGTCGASPCGPSTALTALDTIVIDMGTADPAGLGDQFVVLGTGLYSGTASPIALP